jgi:hypothetical protein
MSTECDLGGGHSGGDFVTPIKLIIGSILLVVALIGLFG